MDGFRNAVRGRVLARRVEWAGGPLRVYLRWPGGDVEVPELAGEYRPAGDGLAVRAGPLTVDATGPGDLAGTRLTFDVAERGFVCTKIEAAAITPAWLRQLAPALTGLARELFERNVVRLSDRDGQTIGEPVWQTVEGSFDGRPPASSRAGRPRLAPEHLDLVARLHREAGRLGVERVAYIGGRFPHYSPATIRGWVRKARQRGHLEPYSPD